MYVKRHYSLWMTIRWSRKSLYYGLLYASSVTLIYELTDLEFTLPWEPISVIGIAVAFYLGFKNNSSYDRMWEARKIWGAIVNDSRTFATAILTLMKTNPTEKVVKIQKELIRRHLAWLLALQNVLRKKRTWEHNEDPTKLGFAPSFCEDYKEGIDNEILQYISAEEYEFYKTKSNIPSQLLKKQAEAIQLLEAEGLISDFKHVWLHQIIGKLYDNQGMCERIKNFPLPRQYASTALWMNYVFCALIPFGLLNIFQTSSVLHIWLTIPFSGLIIWIFFLMDRIGDYSENPFEAAYNDVPISSITRAIEIDLREMIGDENIPEPYPVENGFLM
ncbi:bestrophin family protein [Lunatibacter salilacus]|uniref:bestrophin family protein n=1 Tax=Lunatibacter salilacus TaxID=2483804 RepID=UPI00131E5944|nr:bestrophin family ion channel [Lunatibacter salilacus]